MPSPCRGRPLGRPASGQADIRCKAVQPARPFGQFFISVRTVSISVLQVNCIQLILTVNLAMIVARRRFSPLLVSQSPYDFRSASLSCPHSYLQTLLCPTPLTPFPATLPQNSPVTPFPATLPNSLDLKSFICHTSEKQGVSPRGTAIFGCPSFSSRAATLFFLHHLISSRS